MLASFSPARCTTRPSAAPFAACHRRCAAHAPPVPANASARPVGRPVLQPSSAHSAHQQPPVRVHVAAVPLAGFEAMAQRLGRLYPDQLALHTLVVLQRADGSCTAYDFLPLQPTSPATAARLFSGLAVPGEARIRQLRRGLPRRRCWLVADAPHEAVARAERFQQAWPTELRLLRNDCRSHTASLVEELTGVHDVLSMLPVMGVLPSL